MVVDRDAENRIGDLVKKVADVGSKVIISEIIPEPSQIVIIPNSFNCRTRFF